MCFGGKETVSVWRPQQCPANGVAATAPAILSFGFGGTLQSGAGGGLVS